MNTEQKSGNTESKQGESIIKGGENSLADSELLKRLDRVIELLECNGEQMQKINTLLADKKNAN